MALIVVVSLPPGMLLWIMIHPFARFWRRLGPGWTYTLLSVPVVGLMVALFLARRTLLAIDFGTSYLLMGLGVLCVAGGSIIAVKRRKYLTFGIMAGLPELSPQRHPQRLLAEGIYARIRHPRYVEVLLAVLGYALFANHVALYVVFLVALPMVLLIVVLEERELCDRFGLAYEEYRRKVPRFVPKLTAKP